MGGNSSSGKSVTACDKITPHFPARLLPEDSEKRVLSVLCSPSLSLEVASHLSGEQMAVAAQSCVAWREISMDEDLWRLFCTREVETSSNMGSWRSTYIDLVAGTFDAPLPDPVNKDEYGIYDYLCKIILIGDSNVGSSSYMQRLVNDCFQSRQPRVFGIDFGVMTVQCCKQQLKLQIRDKQGQELPLFYRGASIVLVLYDITDRESFEDCTEQMEKTRRYAPENVSVGLVGCKSDLEHKREVQIEEGAALAAAWEQQLGSCRVFFTETSSLTGKNIERATARVVREWLKLRLKLMLQSEKAPAPAPKPPEPTKSKCVLC